MTNYYAKYRDGDLWVPFSIPARTMNEALDWIHVNIQDVGVCIWGEYPQRDDLAWAIRGWRLDAHE